MIHERPVRVKTGMDFTDHSGGYAVKLRRKMQGDIYHTVQAVRE